MTRERDVSHLPMDSIYRQMLAAVQATSVDTQFQRTLCRVISPPRPTSLWPSLSYWSGIAAGSTPDIQAMVTAALLLGRLASAVLDDVQDRDEGVYRGQFEPRQGVPIATALAFTAQIALERLRDLGTQSHLIEEARADYVHTVVQACSGQHREMATQDSPNLEDYLATVEAKAALVCAFEARISALLAGQPSEIMKHFSEFGRQLGFMYQVSNDFSGLYGLHGKPIDIGRQWTWPTIYALTVAEPLTRQALLSAWRGMQTNQVREVTLGLGASHYLVLLSEQHYQAAKQALHSLERHSIPVKELAALLERFRLHAKDLQVGSTTAS
jgi:geranylgeranyl pyrophosphate synthase